MVPLSDTAAPQHNFDTINEVKSQTNCREAFCQIQPFTVESVCKIATHLIALIALV